MMEMTENCASDLSDLTDTIDTADDTVFQQVLTDHDHSLATRCNCLLIKLISTTISDLGCRATTDDLFLKLTKCTTAVLLYVYVCVTNAIMGLF